MANDLTREEIYRACEAVGWNWRSQSGTVPEGSQCAFAPTGKGHHPAVGRMRFPEYRSVYGSAEMHRDASVADALALLEATGCQYTIERFLRPEPSWGIYMEDSGMGHASGEGFDLPTAAVRAVNQWAETKKETDHE